MSKKKHSAGGEINAKSLSLDELEQSIVIATHCQDGVKAAHRLLHNQNGHLC